MKRFSRWVGLSIYRAKSALLNFRWVVVGSTVATLGVVDLFHDIPLVVVTVAALVTLVLAVFDIRAHRRAWKSTTFPPRDSESFRDLTSALGQMERFDTWVYPNGSFIHDRFLSLKIAGGLMATLDASPYAPPPALTKIGRRHLDHVLSKQHNNHFNGPIVGWGTNIDDVEAVEKVLFVPSNYHMHIATDHLATVDVEQDGVRSKAHGRRLFIDRHGHLRDFGDSWLLNGVGVSTLAFTSDGMLLLIEQGINNINSRELFAPSGSGALEPADFQGSRAVPLWKLAENGGNRELTEESGVRPHEIVSSHFLGYGRWLNKAGRPELFTLSFLSVDSHTLKVRPIKSEEKSYVKRQEFKRLEGPPMIWSPDSPEKMLPADYQNHLSVPLAAGLSLLAQKWQLLNEVDKSFLVRSAN